MCRCCIPTVDDVIADLAVQKIVTRSAVDRVIAAKCGQTESLPPRASMMSSPVVPKIELGPSVPVIVALGSGDPPLAATAGRRNRPPRMPQLAGQRPLQGHRAAGMLAYCPKG